ncbi:hypothetical protein ACFQ46_24100 [Kineococcus sp. GCM10028916]|uniref:hypothetical protein n=1 Tax=Kineococcus sp. GCM10028916 TaxID=3273394 RepID=UPI0036272178
MHRLSNDDVACWLVKSAGRPAELEPTGWQAVRRCLRPSYRLGLMAAGQPCLLWVSGARDPGVAAVGRLAGVPGDDDRVELDLLPLRAPVERSALLADGRFRAAEVIRMAAGSNPSYLRSDQLAAVLERLADDDRDAWGLTPP